jgi:hypothetical protein
MYSLDAFDVVFAATSVAAVAAAFAVICAVTSVAAFAVTSVAAFAATKAWIAIKAIFVTPVTPVIPDTPDSPVASAPHPVAPLDAPEPLLLSVLPKIPDDDLSRTWPADKTLMLKMTSKSFNEVINKIQLPIKPELNLTWHFDDNYNDQNYKNFKELQIKMKRLSVLVKKYKIAKLVLKCFNVRISMDDIHKVIGDNHAPEEWFEKVSEQHASLVMSNVQANISAPVVYDAWIGYSIPGGPDIVWTFQP